MNICPLCAMRGHLVALTVVGIVWRCPDCLMIHPRP